MRRVSTRESELPKKPDKSPLSEDRLQAIERKLQEILDLQIEESKQVRQNKKDLLEIIGATTSGLIQLITVLAAVSMGAVLYNNLGQDSKSRIADEYFNKVLVAAIPLIGGAGLISARAAKAKTKELP